MRVAVWSLSVLALVAGDVYVTGAQQESTSPRRRQFVACPIVRDTKTQPCWLAEYEGELYYLGQQSGVANDFYPPQLGHLALVKARWGRAVCAVAFRSSRSRSA